MAIPFQCSRQWQNLAQHLCLISHLDTNDSLTPHGKAGLAPLAPLTPPVLD